MEQEKQVLNEETADEQALQEETGEQEVQTFSQQDVDRIVSKALDTREKKLRAELESEKKKLQRAKLEEEQEYKALYEQATKEAESLKMLRETSEMLSEKNLGNLLPVFESDLSTMDGRVAVTDKLTEFIEAEVEKRVTERIKTPSPAKGKASQPKLPHEMTSDELKEYRKSKGIF